jgi:hypothetical protein
LYIGAVSRAMLQRLACRSAARGVFQSYSSRSSPELRLNQRKNNDALDNTKSIVLRRFDTDSCLVVLHDAQETTPTETRPCSFHTIPEDENETNFTQETVRVIITDADENCMIRASTPCLRTPSAYVIAIEGDKSIQNGSVQVIYTDADAKSNRSNSPVANGVSKISVDQPSTGDGSNPKILFPQIRPLSSLAVACKDRGALSLQDMSTFAIGNGSVKSVNSTDNGQRGRRHTEAANCYMSAPVTENKFHSDPGGLAPKRLGSVERLQKRKITPKVKRSPTNAPILRNLAPKWRLSVEALDKSNTVSTSKSSGLRGSILALLGKGHSSS